MKKSPSKILATDTITPAKAVPAKRKPAAKPSVKTAPAKSTPKKAKPALVRLFQVTPAGVELADAACEPFALKATGVLPLVDGLRQLSLDPAVTKSPYWGLLPHDFTQRTGLTGETLRQAIAAKPGFEVYFCHAHPELEAVYHNPWLQAEVTHPNFLILAREFLKAAGLSEAPLDTITSSAHFATGHLVVATPEFWVDYLAFIDTAVAKAHAGLGKTARAALFEEPVQPGKFSYLYLIVARLLGIFLTLKDRPGKSCKLVLPPEKDLNVHLRLLREMKDTAIVQKSRWMTACWANYRALYFAQTLGKPWMNAHMPAISPKSLRLGVPALGIDYAYLHTTEATKA
jgi:hypothetical protein